MKIVKIETIRYPPQPNILWVRLHSEEGFIGLGETFYLPSAVEAVVHDTIAGFVLGQSAFDIERIWDEVFSYTNFFGFAGAEMRALSAVDVALWDLIGQRLGQPVYNLIGGRTRDKIPVYNTCVNSGLSTDYDDFIERPAQLAKSLFWSTPGCDLADKCPSHIGLWLVSPWEELCELVMPAVAHTAAYALIFKGIAKMGMA